MRLKEFLIHYFEELLRFFSVILLTGLFLVFDNLIQRQPIGYEYFIIGLGQSRYILFFLLSVAIVQHARNKALSIDSTHYRLLIDTLIAVSITLLSTAFMNELNVGYSPLFTIHSGGMLGYSINDSLIQYKYHPLFFFIGTILLLVFSSIPFLKIAAMFWDTIDMLMIYISDKLGFKRDNVTSNIALHFDAFNVHGNNVIQTTEINELSMTTPIPLLADLKNPLANTVKKALNDMKLNDIQVNNEVKCGALVSTVELMLPDTMSVEVLDKEGKMNDLTRRLKVESLRLVYRVKGTDSVFLEIPNDKFLEIPWENTLNSAVKHYDVSNMKLPLLLGVDTNNHPMMYDLSTFPHLLVAGTTQSGKTVGVHSMICSMIALKSDIKFILVDPKLNEFIHYESSSYLLNVLKPFERDYMGIDDLKVDILNRIRAVDSIAYGNDSDKPLSTIGDNESVQPELDRDQSFYFKGYESYQVENGIVSDMSIVSDILLRLTVLMDVRSARLSVLKAPNIVDYNRKHDELNGVYSKNGVDYTFEKMDYIVLIVDELADLMSQYSKQVEPSIKRLAQKARSVGIHLILSTQRPSIDVVTGLIKANLPARLSYRLATSIDSKTVNIDGAQLLLGRGDCLMSNDLVTNKRMHSAFITPDVIHSVVSGSFTLAD